MIFSYAYITHNGKRCIVLTCGHWLLLLNLRRFTKESKSIKMSKLFLLLVVVVCVLGLSFGASFDEIHKKIRANSRKTFKEVATTAALGTVGFGVLKSFQSSSTCSGTVSAGFVIGTGVCFSSGTGSAANIVGDTTGTTITLTMNTYSDTACTTLSSTDVQSGSTTCVGGGGVSQIGFFSTSFPSLSSTFGVGTFSG